jgi:phosphate butyryltransferase
MELKTLSQLVEKASGKGIRKLVVAVAQDEDVLMAVNSAVQSNLVSPVLVGNLDEIMSMAKKLGIDTDQAELVHEPDAGKACEEAVRIIKSGDGEILMKGLVSTGLFVKAILDKEKGLLRGGLLSHLALFESSYYHKIIGLTDAALNIAPDLNEKALIIQNAVRVYHRLGIEKPLIAVLAPVETVNPKIESTVHAGMLSMMQKKNQICGCLIDGPLALDNAVSKHAAVHKGIVSEVAGNADLLVAPDLDCGNMIYKSLNFLGGAVSAAIVAGACVPVVLTSRADQDKSKFLSIALAAAMV